MKESVTLLPRNQTSATLAVIQAGPEIQAFEEPCMAKFHIGVIRPEGYKHSECFREVAEGLQSALRSLGHSVVIAENSVDAQATSIVLGAHLLSLQEMESLPSSTIVGSVLIWILAPAPFPLNRITETCGLDPSSVGGLRAWAKSSDFAKPYGRIGGLA